VDIQKKVPGGDMSINKYDEQKFWEEVDILFPDIVKAITSLAKKSYISITNLRNGVTWWSEKAMEYFGMQENYTIRGQEKSKRSIHSDDLEDFRRGFQERVAGKNMDEPWEYRVRDGSTYNRISARARMLNDKDGKPFVIVIRYNNYGISDEVDATTGLHTEPALDREIREFLEESGQGTLLKIGLDQFSHINVMYGAAFSDKILNCAAQELLRLLKGKGYVYRLSGAKFVISFKKVSKEELQQIYDEIVEVFENTEVEGKKIPLKVSAGAIFMEPYMKETNAVRSRLTYALNHSRLEHHGELVIFNDEICGSDENQFELIGVIHQCATHNFEGFRMFYQPIADTKTGKIRGMEALLRWELEPYGMVSPGVFMEWLEQDPCIFDLGNWILRTALTDVQKLRKETEGFFVNVNVAAAQLERREFRSAVMNILKETGAKPEELCLELTERCRDLDIQFLRREVEFFHSQGIKIALDDFGTGNSSLSLALELPFDELKVDMSFIRDIKQKPQNQAMVQSIVDYARRTNTETCIEGIEDKEVSDYIEKFGSTWQQGYYYSKPVPIEQFEEVLRKNETEKDR
jgi:diguanylate cyclase (GGDEF)-like protein